MGCINPPKLELNDWFYRAMWVYNCNLCIIYIYTYTQYIYIYTSVRCIYIYIHIYICTLYIHIYIPAALKSLVLNKCHSFVKIEWVMPRFQHWCWNTRSGPFIAIRGCLVPTLARSVCHAQTQLVPFGKKSFFAPNECFLQAIYDIYAYYKIEDQSYICVFVYQTLV